MQAPPPPAAQPPAATPHSFTRCRVVGTDPTLDFLACPSSASIVRSLPDLGWVDASSIMPGHRAAPLLAISAALIPPAFFDWDAPAFSPVLQMAELVSSFTVTALARFADGLEALGVFSRVYHNTQVYLDAVEVALGQAPSHLERRVARAWRPVGLTSRKS